MKKLNKYSRRDILKTSASTASVFALSTGFPTILKAENNIKIGVPTILSGRVAQLGISVSNALNMAVDNFNKSGGLDGRNIELIIRDSRAKPDEAARVCRNFINSDKVDAIINAEASGASFAVQEVIRESGTLCLHTVSETTSLTADPSIRTWNAFRFSRQGIHDAVGSAEYAAKLVKEKGLKKWMSIGPDYAYGRDSTKTFFDMLQKFAPGVEIVGQGWPKLFQPDYTEVITQIVREKPDAIYSCLWGGDLVSFVNQAILYDTFKNSELFAINLADYTTMSAIKNLPKGLHSATRYVAAWPNTQDNRDYDKAYTDLYGDHPTNWSWETSIAIDYLINALKETGSTDNKKLAEALKGKTRKSFMGVGEGNSVTIRNNDQTLVDYSIGWGTTIPNDPFVKDIQSVDWNTIKELEKEWLINKGWL
ncbi:MAG TPA: ABC transporter substrate-binding protein [Alphaproteobacteria bacterium]|nr:ABC transporter substrate-binding protein [Alphaproteobacteria bacterium]HIK87065.1 ABC transporter substrate-binding protein [Alphaproteobacteria bacterium]